jgi:hypothetical protein
MRESIGAATVAVLELKRQRAQKAIKQLDQLQEQIEELLNIAPTDNACGAGKHRAGDYVTDFLSGKQEPLELCRLLGIEVEP